MEHIRNAKRIVHDDCILPMSNMVEMEDVTRQRWTFTVIKSITDGTIVCETCSVLARQRVHKKHGHPGPLCSCTLIGPVTKCPHIRAAIASGLLA